MGGQLWEGAANNVGEEMFKVGVAWPRYTLVEAECSGAHL